MMAKPHSCIKKEVKLKVRQTNSVNERKGLRSIWSGYRQEYRYGSTLFTGCLALNTSWAPAFINKAQNSFEALVLSWHLKYQSIVSHTRKRATQIAPHAPPFLEIRQTMNFHKPFPS
jgi:hypothetical protein